MNSNNSAGFLAGVYAWMFVGMFFSAFSALAVLMVPALTQLIFGNTLVFYGLLIFEFLLVVSLAGLARQMPAILAALLFLLYSIVTGLTLAVIFFIYELASIFIVFVVAAGMFAAMGAYGFLTKRDLSGMGSMLTMALLGMILAIVVNIFLGSSMLDMLISVAGVIIFTGLTAYDVQKIKRIGAQVRGEAAWKASILGALSLYLDFINLFLSLLRLFGKRRN